MRKLMTLTPVAAAVLCLTAPVAFAQSPAEWWQMRSTDFPPGAGTHIPNPTAGIAEAYWCFCEPGSSKKAIELETARVKYPDLPDSVPFVAEPGGRFMDIHSGNQKTGSAVTEQWKTLTTPLTPDTMETGARND